MPLEIEIGEVSREPSKAILQSKVVTAILRWQAKATNSGPYDIFELTS